MSKQFLGIPRAFEVSDGQHLRVLEIYQAVQGEGILTGVPSTFVRLAGCAVGCHFCDTKFSWKADQGDKWLPDALAGWESPYSHIVLTGGEPMDHPAPLLVSYIHRSVSIYGNHLTVETSGLGESTYQVADDLDGRLDPENILWSVSPKISLDAVGDFPVDFDYLLSFLVEREFQIQVKLVVSPTKSAIRQAASKIRKYGALGITTILQPLTDIGLTDPDLVGTQILNDLQVLQELTLGNHPDLAQFDIRFLPQLHACIYGQRRGI